jgi:ParB family transcriptional regulator, chromosome partitioning protein
MSSMLRTRLKSYLKALTVVDVLPLKTIVPSPFPLREDIGNIEELVQSIRRRGLLEPIIVRPKKSKFEIVCGHRRYLACRTNGFHEIPVVILNLTDQEAFEIAMEENLHRKSLDPIEEARAFKVYTLKWGYGSITEIAKRVGKSQEYVSQRLGLLNLPPSVQDLVMRRLITGSSAWEICRVKDADEQKVLAETAIKDKLTVRQTRLAANLLNERHPIDDTMDRVGPIGLTNSSARESTEAKNYKIDAAVTTILRATLVRIDNIVDGLGSDKRQHQRRLTELRYSIHQVIDGFLKAEGNEVDTGEIRSFLERYLDGYNSKDPSKYFETVHPTLYSLFDDFLPPSLMLTQDAKDHITHTLGTFDSSNCEIEDVTIIPFGYVTVITLMFHYNLQVGGIPYHARSRATMVLLKSEGEWKIVHEHWSLANHEQESLDTVRKIGIGSS